MSFRGFLFRFITISLGTWIIGSFTSLWFGLYLAVLPFAFYELIRPR